MLIVKAYPPNIDKIDAVFGPCTTRPGVFYAYGNTIFNPDNVEVPPWLIAHEAVHGYRQLNPAATEEVIIARYAAMTDEQKIEGWWTAYLADKEFRFAEELVAHGAEWRYFAAVKGHDRNLRRRYLTAIAERLSGPLYGELMSLERSKAQIKKIALDSHG